jgi:hypothetical protein
MPSVSPDRIWGLLNDIVPEGRLPQEELSERAELYRDQVNQAGLAAGRAALLRAREKGIQGTPAEADLRERAFAVAVGQELEEIRQALLVEFPETPESQ